MSKLTTRSLISNPAQNGPSIINGSWVTQDSKLVTILVILDNSLDMPKPRAKNPAAGSSSAKVPDA